MIAHIQLQWFDQVKRINSMRLLIKFFLTGTVIAIPIAFVGCKPTSSNPEARKVVFDFYEWYINDAYKNLHDYYQVPGIKKIGDQKYIFDKNELKNRLDEIPYLSQSYKEEILGKMETCNGMMNKKKWDHEPEPQFDIRECDYLWFDNWVGGQGENISGFNIVSEKEQGPDTEFIVEIQINQKRFTKSKVTVKDENGTFKIATIELVWN